jgi:hypothetical protein
MSVIPTDIDGAVSESIPHFERKNCRTGSFHALFTTFVVLSCRSSQMQRNSDYRKAHCLSGRSSTAETFD